MILIWLSPLKSVVLKLSDIIITSSDGEIYHVNHLEKLIATLLSKLSNFIPEAGIWMNTQRPEWNDANNALVGNGVSMVTLYYIRRFLSFFKGIVDKSKFNALPLSKELAYFLLISMKRF